MTFCQNKTDTLSCLCWERTSSKFLHRIYSYCRQHLTGIKKIHELTEDEKKAIVEDKLSNKGHVYISLEFVYKVEPWSTHLLLSNNITSFDERTSHEPFSLSEKRQLRKLVMKRVNVDKVLKKNTHF